MRPAQTPRAFHPNLQDEGLIEGWVCAAVFDHFRFKLLRAALQHGVGIDFADQI
jgi:hypothetical protein